MNQAQQPTRIIMLGGGYVSVLAYRSLAKRLKRELKQGQVELIVVTPVSQHAFHGWTGEVLGGIVPMSHYLTPLRPLLKHAQFIGGRALSVDLDQQTVQVALSGPGEHQQTLHYDHLLIGTGSYDQQEGLPGLDQYAWKLKDMGSVQTLRNHLLELLEQADSLCDEQAQERLLSIVVAGGGFAGVEVCAAIAELLQVAARHYPVLRKHKARLILVHAGQTLLPQYLPHYERLTVYATRELAAYGVDIRFETRLTSVTADGAYLSDGSFIPAQTVISTVGQVFTPLPGTESLQRAEDGRILTDENLHALGHANVWAGGDVASVIHQRSQRPCPANALWAMKHGERAGDNIARAAQNQPLLPFTYPGLGQAASLGIGKGAVELYGFQFTGWLGWVLRFFFFLGFMPSRVQALRVALDWLTLPFFGRHFVSLRPPAKTD